MHIVEEAKENNSIPTTKKQYKRIMLVDEDVGLLIPIKNGLEKYGFIVDTFSKPVEALSSFKPHMYDLVLLGIRMSPINGFELCKKMQKKITNKLDVKFCFMTSFDPYRQVLQKDYSELSVTCFIILPIAIDELIKLIEKELDR